MIDFLMPGDSCRHHRATCRSRNPHRLADHHRGRLFHRSGFRRFQPAASRTSSPMPPNIADPKTVFGLILAGLMRRRDDGTAPFTVMSCDNIPHNGHVTCDAVVGLGRAGRCRSGRLGQAKRRISQRHGRSHHAGDHRPRARPLGDGFRHRGQLAGVLRAVQAMGAGGSISRPGGRRWKRSACRSSGMSRLMS